MKKNMFLLFPLIFTACAAPTQTFVAENTALPAQATQFTPIPTFTAEVQPTVDFPTFTPATALPDQPNSIQFPANGTYVDIIDSIKAGERKTYSVQAMQGQVMSLSFRRNDEAQWSYITLRIIGADGSLLCDNDCQFWRGALPATQDYFVTVTPSTDAPDFVMRVAINPPGVAINPPGVATQSFLYENKYSNASFSYTDMFVPSFFPGRRAYRIDPELVLQFIDTQSYADTNLDEAYFLFGSSTDPQIVSVCTEPGPAGGQQTTPENVTVHGIPFVMYRAVDVAAGNIYDQFLYRTIHEGMCFEIVYYMHYTNINNYAPGKTAEFDRDALLQKFDQILSTFAFR